MIFSAMTWEDRTWLEKRQEAYERLLAENNIEDDGIGEGHRRIMALLDALPYSQGGRA